MITEVIKEYPLSLFTDEGKDKVLSDTYKEKEIIEYKLNKLQKDVDKIKSMFFKDLLVFERMKKQNPNLNPDINVLKQMKELENDEVYKKIKQQMDYLKIELRNLNKKIDDVNSKYQSLFQFKNPKIYLNLAKKAINYSSLEDFEMYITELAIELAKNEFQMIEVAPYLKWVVPPDLFEYLILKAPKDYQTLFRHIYEMFGLFLEEFKSNYFKEFPNDKWEDFVNEKILRASLDLKKIKGE